MRLIRPTGLVATAASLVLALAGCAATPAEGEPTAEESGQGTVSFTFDRNVAGEDEDPTYESTTVDVPTNPDNIVVFDMASLDTIGALGGEVDGAPLDSVPDYLSDTLADDAYNAGTLFEADLVEIEAHQPDLIIIGGRSAALYDDLSAIAPTVDLSITGSFLDTLERNTTLLGEVLGAQDQAAAALTEVKAGIDEAKALTAGAGTGLGVMVSGGKLSAMAPTNGNATGRNARGGIIYDVFGVTPVIDDIEAATHGEPISFEFLLEHDPDYLYVVDRDAATGSDPNAKPAAEVLDNDIVKQTKAFREGHIVYLDPVAWYIVFGGIETTTIMTDDVKQAA